MTTTAQHWALPYLGRPWISGARGPDSFDCWGFLRWIYRERYNLEIPSFVGVDAEDHLAVRRLMLDGERSARDSWPDWVQTSDPVEGCAVALGRFEYLFHVGIYIELPEGGRVLHCKKPIGVLHQSLAQLRSEGLSRFVFYRHASHCAHR